MAYLFPEKIKRPRILLVDFDRSEGKRLENFGYSVIAAKSGLIDGERSFPCVPSEVDIMVVNAYVPPGAEWWIEPGVFDDVFDDQEPSPPQPHQISLSGDHVISDMPLNTIAKEVIAKNGWVVIFAADSARTHMQWLSPLPIQLGPSYGLHASGYIARTDGLDAGYSWPHAHVAAVIERHRADLREMPSFAANQETDSSVKWVWRSALIDESSSPKSYSALGQRRKHGLSVQGYLLLLPRFRDNISVAVDLLQEPIPQCSPDPMFPTRKPTAWMGQLAYCPAPVCEVMNKLDTLREEHRIEEESLQALAAARESEYSFLQQMLMSDDHPEHFDKAAMLSPAVERALDLLGFEATIQDPEREASGESKHEDMHVRDSDGYFALVEIKGTERGSKASWLQQWHKHFRQFALNNQGVDVRTVNGLIVANYERNVAPLERNGFFHANADAIQEATDAHVGLLSTWELFKICNAVLTGDLAKENARALIKRPGVIQCP